MSVPIDTLLHAQWIIPAVPEGQVLEDHCLAIQGGRIRDILPSVQARMKYSSGSVLELPGQTLIPGLINAHTHAAMSLLRGLADDLPLMTWLNEHIWPAEGKWVSTEFVHDGSQLAIAEMLLGGTTCFNDMYFFPDVTARAADAAGIRAVVGLIAIDFPSAWAADADAYLHKGLEVHDQFRGNRLIRTAFAPHAPYSVADRLLERVRIFADELEIPIHIHLHESHDEILQGLRQYGKRPMQRLQELGLLSPALLAVHMTHLEAGEIEQFALGWRPCGALSGIQPEAGQRFLPGQGSAAGRDQCGTGHRRRGQQQRSGHVQRDAHRRPAGQGGGCGRQCGAGGPRPRPWPPFTAPAPLGWGMRSVPWRSANPRIWWR